MCTHSLWTPEPPTTRALAPLLPCPSPLAPAATRRRDASTRRPARVYAPEVGTSTRGATAQYIKSAEWRRIQRLASVEPVCFFITCLSPPSLITPSNKTPAENFVVENSFPLFLHIEHTQRTPFLKLSAVVAKVSSRDSPKNMVQAGGVLKFARRTQQPRQRVGTRRKGNKQIVTKDARWCHHARVRSGRGYGGRGGAANSEC